MKIKPFLFIGSFLIFMQCNQKNNTSVNQNILEDNQKENIESSIEDSKAEGSAKGKLLYYADAFTFTFCDKPKSFFVKPNDRLYPFEKIILNIEENYIFIEADYLIEEVVNQDGLLSKQIILKNIVQISGC